MTLSASNNYAGPTVISSGTLSLGGGIPDGMDIMPLGDSITYGTDGGGGGTNAGYRGPLYNLLTASGHTLQYVGSQTNNPGALPITPINETHHEGHSGCQTGDVTNGVLHGVKTVASGGQGWLTVNPDLILLDIGTNRWNFNHITNKR